jgi:hypothetical protein
MPELTVEVTEIAEDAPRPRRLGDSVDFNVLTYLVLTYLSG